MIDQEVEEIMDDEEEIRKKYFLSIYRDGANEIAKQLADRICNAFLFYDLDAKPPREFISSTNFYQEYFMLILWMTQDGFLNYQISRVYRKDGKINNLLSVPLRTSYKIFDIINRKAMGLNEYSGNDLRLSKQIHISSGTQMPKAKDITNISEVFHMLSIGNLDKKLETALIRESSQFGSIKDYPYTKIEVIPNVMHWKVKWMTQHIAESLMGNDFFDYPMSLGYIEARITPTELGTIALLPIVIEHYKYKKDIINESC